MQSLTIPASKSISNRLLILQYLYPSLKINNLSTAKDTRVLQEALQQIRENEHSEINIGHAGTAMRFLTALLSTLEGKTFVLDGSERMRQRPIKILVEALKYLGADIDYIQKSGYPALRIKGKKLTGNTVEIAQNISSQYISALLLIAPKLPNGLTLHLNGKQVSKPYVQMSLSILSKLGIHTEQDNKTIIIYPADKLDEQQTNIEGDWSSASYFYGAMSVLNQPEFSLKPFDENSLQGDRKIVSYFETFGIKTTFNTGQEIVLTKEKDFKLPEFVDFDLLETPDLAQTLAVTCLALGIKCRLTGLQTLRIKETDRLHALQTEMQKLGTGVRITDDSFELLAPVVQYPNVSIDTYNDHRMAMSFAILQKKYPELVIKHPEVVVKSFPNFWELFNEIR